MGFVEVQGAYLELCASFVQTCLAAFWPKPVICGHRNPKPYAIFDFRELNPTRVHLERLIT